MNFIASPEIVTALAIAGKLSFNPLTDSLTGSDGKAFMFEPPKTAAEVPSEGFTGGHSAYVAPPEDGGIGLVGLTDMAPGKPIECLVAHVDGSTETLQLDHSFAKSQLEWFRLGSALNLFQESARQAGVCP